MTIEKLYNLLLSFFFPKDALLAEIESMDARTFKTRATLSPSTHALFLYKDPLVKTLIWNMKFRRNQRCFEIASNLIYAEIVRLCTLSDLPNPLIIPVPISNKRKRERGYNQTELLLHARLHKEFQVDTSCVVKKSIPPQTSLSRKARQHNMKGSLTVVKPSCVTGRTIIIVDDVITTGATMEEMSRVLYEAGAHRILLVALAH